MPLRSTRAQSISSQETVTKRRSSQFSGASATPERKNSQQRDQQVPYFTSLNSNVTDYSASVLIGDFSPWRHLTACTPCHEVGTNPIHGLLTLDHRHAEFAMCTSQKRTFSQCTKLCCALWKRRENDLGSDMHRAQKHRTRSNIYRIPRDGVLKEVLDLTTMRRSEEHHAGNDHKNNCINCGIRTAAQSCTIMHNGIPRLQNLMRLTNDGLSADYEMMHSSHSCRKEMCAHQSRFMGSQTHCIASRLSDYLSSSISVRC